EFLQELRGFALYLPRGMDFRWQSVGEYLKAFDAEGTALNVMQLVGHGTLRIAAMGTARRAPDRKALARMQRLMADAMEDGAWGPGGWRRGDAPAAPHAGGARADPSGARGAGDGPKPPRPRRLGEHHARVVPAAEGRRGQASVRGRRRTRDGPARRGTRAHRG